MEDTTDLEVRIANAELLAKKARMWANQVKVDNEDGIYPNFDLEAKAQAEAERLEARLRSLKDELNAVYAKRRKTKRAWFMTNMW